ncbi:MAG: hypothetical protein K0R15_1921 [Clostridiales bacterium]|jgi:hypothetical protein|nr:hypothetical protein [Clostridiales bacterium]
MNWLRKFMYGRYGSDKISYAILIVYLFMATITFFSGVQVFIWFGYILIIWSLYRTLSKNIYRRQRENQMFLRATKPMASWFSRQKNKVKNLKTHKYFNCPNCKQHLRAPKGKGRITITCPKCKRSFEMRT